MGTPPTSVPRAVAAASALASRRRPGRPGPPVRHAARRTSRAHRSPPDAANATGADNGAIPTAHATQRRPARAQNPPARRAGSAISRKASP